MNTLKESMLSAGVDMDSKNYNHYKKELCNKEVYHLIHTHAISILNTMLEDVNKIGTKIDYEQVVKIICTGMLYPSWNQPKDVDFVKKDGFWKALILKFKNK